MRQWVHYYSCGGAPNRGFHRRSVKKVGGLSIFRSRNRICMFAWRSWNLADSVRSSGVSVDHIVEASWSLRVPVPSVPSAIDELRRNKSRTTDSMRDEDSTSVIRDWFLFGANATRWYYLLRVTTREYGFFL